MSLKTPSSAKGNILLILMLIVCGTMFNIWIRIILNEAHKKPDYQLYVGFNSITVKQKDRVVGVITEKSDSTFYNLILKDNE